MSVRGGNLVRNATSMGQDISGLQQIKYMLAKTKILNESYILS